MFHTIRTDDLEYLTADTLAGSIHCFSTRYGGVSTGFLSSLNLGTHRDDTPENVRENYAILGRAVGFSPAQTVFTKQQHTAIVRPAARADCGTGLDREQTDVCDGLVTNVPGVALVCFAADCTSVLLYDPVARAVAAVHSGWRGTAQGIAARAVEQLRRLYGCDPKNIRAALGPSIGPCCFETDEDVPSAMRAALGAAADPYITRRGAKFFVDNKGLCALWLQTAGVTAIDVSPDCTKCQPERFWSHRAAGVRRGSLAAVIMLPQEEAL